MDKAHKNITTAGDTIETLMGTKTRAIQRTLKGVESSTQTDATLILQDVAGINEWFKINLWVLLSYVP